MKSILLIIGWAFLFTACSGKKQKAAVEQPSQKSFQMVEVPTMYVTSELRAAFIVSHYWDHFDFADTAYVNLPKVTEQAWVDYVDMFQLVNPEVWTASVTNTFKSAETDQVMYRYFMGLADKYLYDPNSPMRNENAYLVVLDALIASPVLSETEKSKLNFRRQMALKNRVGNFAADFVYTLANGKQHRLSSVKAEYTLLFIHNPGCETCRKTIEEIQASAVVRQLMQDKKLKVLALYPDEELNDWKRYADEIPAQWINAYDKEFVIKKKELYDLKAIPTLYLLDADKKVLLKDATWSAVEKYLFVHTSNVRNG